MLSLSLSLILCLSSSLFSSLLLVPEREILYIYIEREQRERERDRKKGRERGLSQIRSTHRGTTSSDLLEPQLSVMFLLQAWQVPSQDTHLSPCHRETQYAM